MEAFGSNDFDALPALQAEIERLSVLLQQAASAGKTDEMDRQELERSQEERLAQLRADIERAAGGAQTAVRDKL